MWNCRQTYDTVSRYLEIQCQAFDASVTAEKGGTSSLQGFTLIFLSLYFSKSKLFVGT